MRNSILNLFVFVLLSGCTTIHSAKDSEIAYTWNQGNMVHIYNLSTWWSSEEGRDYLSRRNGRYSDFGGSFRYCESTEYLCVIGGIAAAIPRKISGQKEWDFENWSCSTKSPLSSDKINLISCSYKGRITLFKYDVMSGIISYTNKGNATEKTLDLIGDRGLLAN